MSERGAGQSLPSYLVMPLDEVLAAFSDAGAAPGGGSAAVIAVALAAALCTMSARLSLRHLPAAEEIAAQAQSIREALAPLCDEDPQTYLRVLAANRSPAAPDPVDRTRRIAAALSDAAEVPLAVLRAGARLAPLAARLAHEGNPSVRGDAVVAAVLAGAGAEAAGVLVRINLAGVPEDDRYAVVQSLVEEAATWVERARRSVPSPEDTKP